MSNGKDVPLHSEHSKAKPRGSFYNDVEQYLSSVKTGPGRGAGVMMGMSFEPEGHNWSNIVRRIVNSPLHKPPSIADQLQSLQEKKNLTSKPQTAGVTS